MGVSQSKQQKKLKKYFESQDLSQYDEFVNQLYDTCLKEYFKSLKPKEPFIPSILDQDRRDKIKATYQNNLKVYNEMCTEYNIKLYFKELLFTIDEYFNKSKDKILNNLIRKCDNHSGSTYIISSQFIYRDISISKMWIYKKFYTQKLTSDIIDIISQYFSDKYYHGDIELFHSRLHAVYYDAFFSIRIRFKQHEDFDKTKTKIESKTTSHETPTLEKIPL
jgi:hypothetical protein